MPARQRDTGIDVFKGLLVIGMIYDHVVNILQVESLVSVSVSGLVDLVTFSAFMFCFGYVAQLAYFSAERVSYQRIWPSVYRPLLAFYLIAIYIQYIQLGRLLMWQDVVSILLLFRLPYYTEFLVTFSLMMLVAAVLHKPLRWVLESRRRIWITGGLLLLTNFFPYDLIRVGQIGLLVGTPREVLIAFPVLQYFFFFFMGMVFARRAIEDIPLVLKIICLVAIGVIAIYNLKIGNIRRFPPSLQWIAAGTPFVLFEYVVARYLDRIAFVRRWLVPVGENTLFYLVMSNLVIFGLRDAIVHQVSFAASLVLTAFIIFITYYLTSITRRVKTS